MNIKKNDLKKPLNKTKDLEDKNPTDNHPDYILMDLPEVKDIPGQEHIHVPPLGELADTTISSDDEEGKGILDGEEENI